MRPRPVAPSIAVVLVELLAGCTSPISTPVAPFVGAAQTARDQIPAAHPEGTCALCDLYYGARESVIRIEAGRGLGAGVIVDERGYAVTNAHLVADHRVLLVQTNSGESTVGRVVHADSDMDLALVSLAPVSRQWTPMMLQAAAVPRVGSDVYIIGHPVGLGWSVSRGIISGYHEAGRIAASPMIQTDAATSPGNSGGPMIDGEGRVVGIVVSKLAGGGAENVALVLPVSMVREFIAEHLDHTAGAKSRSHRSARPAAPPVRISPGLSRPPHS